MWDGEHDPSARRGPGKLMLGGIADVWQTVPPPEQRRLPVRTTTEQGRLMDSATPGRPRPR
eukprot:6557210-Lingulodinium_polyedra.AAC.1